MILLKSQVNSTVILEIPATLAVKLGKCGYFMWNEKYYLEKSIWVPLLPISWFRGMFIGIHWDYQMRCFEINVYCSQTYTVNLNFVVQYDNMFRSINSIFSGNRIGYTRQSIGHNSHPIWPFDLLGWRGLPEL